MNRVNSLIIIYNEDIKSYLNGNKYEATEGTHPKIGTKYDGLKLLYISEYDSGIFDYPIEVVDNLKMWHDNGVEEVSINKSNYQDYIDDSDSFYAVRKGTYDQIEEI